MKSESRSGRLLVILGVGTWAAVGLTVTGSTILGCAGPGDVPTPATERIAAAATSSSCSFTVTTNKYDGPNWWGTIVFTNNGPSAASNFKVEFDLPPGVHCTAEADAVPAGATLSPLTGSNPPHTFSNHCVFTWTNTTVAPGASFPFNYSTDSKEVTSATNVTISDSMCAGAGSACNTFEIKHNSYDPTKWWGTVIIKNSGPFSSSSYTVAFDVPEGKHCTADKGAVPEGATLSPLVGSGLSAHTEGRHCIFTWANGPTIAVGGEMTFHYSTNSNASSFTKATSVVAGDTMCTGGGGSGGGGGGSTPHRA